MPGRMINPPGRFYFSISHAGILNMPAGWNHRRAWVMLFSTPVKTNNYEVGYDSE
jgi:hypothetical protein